MNELTQSLGIVAAAKSVGVSLIASLSVVAQITIVVLIIGTIAWFASPAARRALASPAATLQSSGVWIAWGVAVVATLSSLWLSEHEHFVPCHLCSIQRFWMYPLVVILAGVAVRKTRWATWAAIVPAAIGLGVSIRHVWVEGHPESDTCAIGGTPCSFKWVDEFGYVTIPVMAGTAFLLIVVLLALAGAGQRGGEARTR
jgi:disulfide bond formation protein DsbB